MGINLNKPSQIVHYYYSKEGVEYGPFELTVLLQKIEANTLVWKEGIEWTNASNVEELKKFFPELVINPENNPNNNTNNIEYTPQKQFAAPFSFDGRIRRTEYGISFIIYLFSYALIAAIAKSSSILFLAFIPLLWFLWAQGAKRCHDRGNSGWYQIIPFYVFWMLFAEGDSTKNGYGNSPK
jgi:uncharacterized membrane protein YhaH (DUF805 family)